MPGQPKPDLKAAKIAYKILKTPKNMQQHTEIHPPEKRIKEWFKDSSLAQ